MVDISNNPRIHHLLARVEKVGGGGASDSESPEIRECYREIGSYVHWLLRQDPAVVRRIEAEGQSWARQVDIGLGFEVPDLPEPPKEEPVDDVSSVDVSLVEAVVDQRAEPAEPPFGDFEVYEVPAVGRASGTPDHAMTDFEEEGVEGWQRQVSDLLLMVGPPGVPTDHGEQTTVVGRILSATDDLARRWEPLPLEVKFALISYLGCRSRALMVALPLDGDLQDVVRSMRLAGEAMRLPPVDSLLVAHPERGSWTADAEHWWSALRLGA